MLKKFYKPVSAYEKYFLEVGENDDETQEEEPTVRVNAAPRRNRGTDYGQVADDIDNGNDNPPDNSNEDGGENQEDNPDADVNNETDQTGNPPEDQDKQDNADNPNDANQEDNATGDEGADGDADEVDPNGEGPTDYGEENDTANQDNANTDNPNDQDNADDTGNNEGDAADDTEDVEEKKQKFYMYSKFVNLYNTINSFIEKIEVVVKNDPLQNVVLTTVRLNLNDISDSLYDYMMFRYKSATYKQVLIYFETVIAAVKLSFELLRNNHISLKH